MSSESRSARRRRERSSGGDQAADTSGAAGESGGPGESGRGSGAALPATRILWLAALFALVGGFGEAVLIRYVLSLGIPLRVSPHFVWMTPLAHILAFGVVAAVLVGVARLWRQAAEPAVVVGVLASVATYSVLLSIEWLHPLVAPLLAAGVGVQMRWLARKRLGPLLVRFAPVAVLGLSLLLVGVTAGSLTAAARVEARLHADLPAAHDRPNVLFIILDTVRAASMGLYDAAKANTPGLEALAGDAVVFDRAYSPSPWTLPAHASMFTGTWPHQHRADWKRPLDRRYPTVAEVMARNGYATAGFVANLTWADRSFGLERGFARYDDYPVSAGQVVLSSGLGRSVASIDPLRAALGLHDTLNRVPAPVVTRRFLRWQEGLPDGRPFFAFLNYFDAHEPVPGSLAPDPIAPLQHRNSLLTGALAQFENRSAASQQRFLRRYGTAYEAAIADLDSELTALFDQLARRGILDNTVVIITSDHGEQIGEYDLFGHTSSLYPPALRVPLLIRYPDGAAGAAAGSRVAEPVSLRNLPATILDLAGAGEDGCCPGRSLARHWRAAAGSTVPADTVFAHLTRGLDSRLVPWAPVVRGAEMASVFDSSHQYILNGDASEELYRLGAGGWEPRTPAGSGRVSAVLGHLRGLLRAVVAPPLQDSEGAARTPGGRR